MGPIWRWSEDELAGACVYRLPGAGRQTVCGKLCKSATLLWPSVLVSFSSQKDTSSPVAC